MITESASQRPSVSRTIDDQLARMIDEISQKLQAGETLEISEYTEKHPEHARSVAEAISRDGSVGTARAEGAG
jgi:hypothetical protein